MSRNYVCLSPDRFPDVIADGLYYHLTHLSFCFAKTKSMQIRFAWKWIWIEWTIVGVALGVRGIGRIFHHWDSAPVPSKRYWTISNKKINIISLSTAHTSSMHAAANTFISILASSNICTAFHPFFGSRTLSILYGYRCTVYLLRVLF